MNAETYLRLWIRSRIVPWHTRCALTEDELHRAFVREGGASTLERFAQALDDAGFRTTRGHRVALWLGLLPRTPLTRGAALGRVLARMGRTPQESTFRAVNHALVEGYLSDATGAPLWGRVCDELGIVNVRIAGTRLHVTPPPGAELPIRVVLAALECAIARPDYAHEGAVFFSAVPQEHRRTIAERLARASCSLRLVQPAPSPKLAKTIALRAAAGRRQP